MVFQISRVLAGAALYASARIIVDFSVFRTCIENDVCDSFVGREVSQHLYSGARNVDRGSAHNRLSNIRQVFVPTLRRRPNSSALLHNHFNGCADSMGRSRRRRSVGSGCTWQWMHSRRHCTCTGMYACERLHVCRHQSSVSVNDMRTLYPHSFTAQVR